MDIPYNTFFNYLNFDEIVNIFENTIATIVNHTRLSSFHVQPLYDVSQDNATNLFSFELTLHNGVSGYDKLYAKKDLSRLNNHFRHLKTDYISKCNELLIIFQQKYQQYCLETQNLGYSEIFIDDYWLDLIDACKKLQYFLYCKISFVSCQKAHYDRFGNTVIVYFKIEY
jgi:hypothetical protein